MAEFTVQPKLRPIAKDYSPPEGLTIDYGGTIWLNFDGVVLCLQFEPPDALVVGGCLLEYASGFWPSAKPSRQQRLRDTETKVGEKR